MGRPPLPVGTAGKISLKQEADGKWQARTYFRDPDGVRREIARWAATKAAANRKLTEAVRDREQAGTGLSGASRMTVLIDDWLERMDARDLALNTKDTYRLAANNWIRPHIGGLLIREVDVPRVDKLLKLITATAGPGAAKTARSVLSGMFDAAARDGTIKVSPVQSQEKIHRAKKQPRSLTPAEVEQLSDYLRSSEQAVEWDLPDLVEFMLATGCRIGEACAVRHAVLELQGEMGTAEINATMIRAKGQGLVLQERTKTDASWRIIALPPVAVNLIRRRDVEARLRAPQGVIFGSPNGHWRDPRNTARNLRDTLDGTGAFEWVTFHTFRRTVATRLDDAGLSARKIADQLGHARPSMTQDRYMGRNVVTAEAATLLDR